jgi:hypothetical protein
MSPLGRLSPRPEILPPNSGIDVKKIDVKKIDVKKTDARNSDVKGHYKSNLAPESADFLTQADLAWLVAIRSHF